MFPRWNFGKPLTEGSICFGTSNFLYSTEALLIQAQVSYRLFSTERFLSLIGADDCFQSSFKPRKLARKPDGDSPVFV
jgi:hypothetical protein